MNNKLFSQFVMLLVFLTISLFLFKCSKDNGVDSQPDAKKPLPPGNVKIQSGNGQIIITWDPALGAESYNLYWSYRQNVIGDAGNVKNAVSPYTHTGLNLDSTYYYRVTSVNEFGESALSDEVKANPHQHATIPEAPGNIHVTAGDKKIMISWDMVPGVAQYNVYWSGSPGVNKNSKRISNVTTPFIHNNLLNGTLYYYRLSAENRAGESDLSVTNYAVPSPATTVPNPPNNVTIYERNSLLTFTWDPVINASLYNVYWSFNSNVSKADNKEIATTTPFDLINMENQKKIYIRISSLNDIGEGQMSVTYNAIPTPLLPPENFQASASYKRATLSWNKVTNATSYNIYWLLSDATDTIPVKISNVVSPFIHDSLNPLAIYRYRITSANPFEESQPSLFETVDPKLIAPDRLVATGKYKENRLVWAAVSHVPSYLVYWRTGSGKDTVSGTIVCPTSSFTHDMLSLNTQYYYRVYSKDGDSLSVDYANTFATTLLDRPAAKAGVDVQVTKGDTVRLRGDGTDSMGTIVKYEWKIGDRDWMEVSSGDTVIIAPDTARSVICSLRVTDNDGLTSVDDMKIVIALNPPSASLQVNPTAIGFNEPVTFTVKASDSGRIQLHEMKFGGNNWITVSGNDTMVRTPSIAGVWVCSLKVTDDDGEYAFARAVITVKSNPPNVTAQGTPLTTGLNDPVTLSCEATDEGSILSYEWKLGGGQWIKTSTGDTVFMTPSTAGICACSLRVTDDDGETSYKIVNVKVESQPPKATAGSNVQTTGLNDPVAFTGYAVDNGIIALYEWKFGSDNWIAVSGGDTVAKSPSTTGNWVCILRAMDDDGENAYDTVIISITSHSPTVTASSNIGRTGLNDPVQFSGTVNDNESSFRYFWKFGNEDWIESQTIAVTKNTPSASGAWLCSLRVIDVDGETGYARISVDVESSPPTVSVAATPFTTGLNEPVTLSTTANDNGAINTYEWKLGNGGWVLASGRDTVVHTPFTPGNWVCGVRVTDDDGEQSTDQVTVTVESNPPVVQATANHDTVGPNDPVTFSASATDNGSIIKYEWKFGNGNWSEVPNGNTTINTPFTIGTWTCSLKVTDDDGETTTKTVLIVIKSSPPMAQASSNPSTSVKTNQSIEFIGSGTDNGFIASYEWKFGNDNWVVVGSGDTTMTAPAVAQSWVCSLKVVDDDHEIGYAALSFYVDPAMITDIDGNSYSTVRVGDQLWIKENLRCRTYNDGSPITHAMNNTAWQNNTDGAYCFYNNTTVQAEREKFGALYNFQAISTGMLAPEGWHVPSMAEYEKLRNFLRLNGYNYDGSMTDNLMGKAVASKTDWTAATAEGQVGYMQNANNASGLNIYPAGYRTPTGEFNSKNSISVLSSVSPAGVSFCESYWLWYNEPKFDQRSVLEKQSGFSVRLIKD